MLYFTPRWAFSKLCCRLNSFSTRCLGSQMTELAKQDLRLFALKGRHELLEKVRALWNENWGLRIPYEALLSTLQSRPLLEALESMHSCAGDAHTRSVGVQRHVPPEDADVAWEASTQQVLECWRQCQKAVGQLRIAAGQRAHEVEQLHVLFPDTTKLFR
ncbi:unnamed protein product [Prorocentrum cordatum]|uniref:Uncharacterized protein n=1 Tax=Prorocentrum cordatum TaxID=2364126 RepID=A0ABN9WPF1_9DINO|nr:unnamed protein product [Polarella glacialis]